MIVTPPYDEAPAPPSTAPAAPPETTVDRTPIDCSDMERLTFERLYNKSFVESQQCESACANDACKQECEYQHENVRAPKLVERFHADACHATWDPGRDRRPLKGAMPAGREGPPASDRPPRGG